MKSTSMFDVHLSIRHISIAVTPQQFISCFFLLIVKLIRSTYLYRKYLIREGCFTYVL